MIPILYNKYFNLHCMLFEIYKFTTIKRHYIYVMRILKNCAIFEICITLFFKYTMFNDTLKLDSH